MSGEPLVGAPREKNYLLFQYLQKLAGLPLIFLIFGIVLLHRTAKFQLVEPPKKYCVLADWNFTKKNIFQMKSTKIILGYQRTQS